MDFVKSVAIGLSSPFTVGMWLLLFAVVLIWADKPQTGKPALKAAIVTLLIFSQSWISELILYPLERSTKVVNEDMTVHADYIYSPACYYYTQGEIPEIARWPECSLQRLLHAAHWAKKLNIPVIITGGNFLADKNIRYADMAKAFLLETGLSEELIIAKVNEGNSTLNEVQSIAPIVKNKTILSVTSATHVTRVRNMLEKQGATVLSSPVDFQGSGDLSFKLTPPSLTALANTEKAIYEYMALVKFYFFESTVSKS